MKKIFCDLCGEDAVSGDFILPKYDYKKLEYRGREVARFPVGVKL